MNAPAQACPRRRAFQDGAMAAARKGLLSHPLRTPRGHAHPALYWKGVRAMQRQLAQIEREMP